MENQIHALFVMMFICLTSADLRLQVTKEECGRSIDLSEENRVVIDFADSDLINMTEFCIIYVTTNSSNEMICITSNRTYRFDSICTWSLSYHIGRYRTYGQGYSCNDFNRKHLCKATRRVALAYSDNILYQNVSISVTLFLKSYIPTTTTTKRPLNNWPWLSQSWSSWSRQPSWSSWSSRTSSYDDNDDELTNKGRSGTIVVVVIIATMVVVALLAVFAVIKFSKKPTPNNQINTYPLVRYSTESHHIDDSVRSATHYAGANDNQTHSSGSQPVPPFSQGPPSYEEYQKHKPVYKPDINNEQPSDADNLTIPSAPPPPYPGY